MARRKPRPTVREDNERALLEAAEWVFAEQGFAGATTAAIAQRAGLPKANLHYYFPTKETLYRSVIERVLTAWLAAASSFDTSEDPTVALSAYIGAKMDLAREMPLATRIWSAEVMRGAPIIQDFLETTLTEWVVSRERVMRRWIAAGKLKPIEPKFLFYMIWATTQQYANAAHEMATLNKGRPLDDKAFERAKSEAIEIPVRRAGGRPELLLLGDGAVRPQHRQRRRRQARPRVQLGVLEPLPQPEHLPVQHGPGHVPERRGPELPPDIRPRPDQQGQTAAEGGRRTTRCRRPPTWARPRCRATTPTCSTPPVESFGSARATRGPGSPTTRSSSTFACSTCCTGRT